jgi:hypothetical protein
MVFTVNERIADDQALPVHCQAEGLWSRPCRMAVAFMLLTSMTLPIFFYVQQLAAF